MYLGRESIFSVCFHSSGARFLGGLSWWPLGGQNIMEASASWCQRAQARNQLGQKLKKKRTILRNIFVAIKRKHYIPFKKSKGQNNKAPRLHYPGAVFLSLALVSERRPGVVIRLCDVHMPAKQDGGGMCAVLWHSVGFGEKEKLPESAFFHVQNASKMGLLQSHRRKKEVSPVPYLVGNS